MRLSRVVVFASAAIAAALLVLPTLAEASTKRRPAKVTVTPKSYLVPGRVYPPRTAHDYYVDVRFRPYVPHPYGPASVGFSNLPTLFDPPGQR